MTTYMYGDVDTLKARGEGQAMWITWQIDHSITLDLMKMYCRHRDWDSVAAEYHSYKRYWGIKEDAA